MLRSSLTVTSKWSSGGREWPSDCPMQPRDSRSPLIRAVLLKYPIFRLRGHDATTPMPHQTHGGTVHRCRQIVVPGMASGWGSGCGRSAGDGWRVPGTHPRGLFGVERAEQVIEIHPKGLRREVREPFDWGCWVVGADGVDQVVLRMHCWWAPLLSENCLRQPDPA